MKNGWQTKKLGELCEIELGRTPSRANRAFWDEKRETSNVWLSIADLLRAEDNVVVDSKEYVSDKGAAKCKLVAEGTLLVSFKLTLGRLAFAGRDLFTNEAIAALTIFNERELSKKYLFYFLHFFDWVKAAENDVKLKGMTLNKAKLKEMDVHFPKSLAEQERIVGLLDRAFEGLATSKANAKKNLRNARALFESCLQSVFAQRRKGWADKMLGDVCQFENGDRGKNYPNRNEYVESGIPWINTGHIQPDGTLSQDEMNFISRKKYESLRSGKIQPGDLVYCLRGATLGKTALVDPLTEGAVASSLVIIRPGKLVDSRFLYSFLTSPLGQGLIKGFENGAAQPNLGAKSVAKYPISLPTLAEQKQMVAKLNELREETQHLAGLYERKLSALDALKRSLMHQAFSGKL